jgi:hypothetical protein
MDMPKAFIVWRDFSHQAPFECHAWSNEVCTLYREGGSYEESAFLVESHGLQGELFDRAYCHFEHY